jgi:putative intracellular protease/amidase
MTTVLMMLTNNDQLHRGSRRIRWYVSEAAYPWKLFSDAGFEVSWASPLGGVAEMDGADLSDPVQAEFLTTYGPLGPQTRPTESVVPSQFDAIFYVSGHGIGGESRSHRNFRRAS